MTGLEYVSRRDLHPFWDESRDPNTEDVIDAFEQGLVEGIKQTALKGSQSADKQVDKETVDKPCDCIKNLNERLKQQFNHTACVNYDVISGRVIVNGIYHKLKKDGSYNPNKWEEVGIIPKFCPFCGKPYDDKKKEDK